MLNDPGEEYTRRLSLRREAAARLDRRHRILGYAKLALALVVAALALQASPWAVPPGAFLVWLFFSHERIIRLRDRLLRAAACYDRGLGRLAHRWQGRGEPGTRFSSPSHPYAEDLDIFGSGSLFELLCTTRTRGAEALLADWLSRPAPPPVVRARQEAISELASQLDFREDMAVLGEEIRSAGISSDFAVWGEGKPLLDSTPTRIAAAILSVTATVGVLLWMAGGSRVPALAALVANLTVFLAYRRRLAKAAGEAEAAAHDLGIFAGILECIEHRHFDAARLSELRRMLDTDGHPPSFRIRKLRRLMGFLESQRSLLVRIIDPVVLWSLQSAFAVEAWRKAIGPAVRRWVDASAEIEALAALAGYAYEHPGDPFPELVETGPCFEAEGLAHPLLRGDRAVRNDVRFGPARSLMVVSGSNMSGKSTLLRAIGMNAVLAQCGAPVRARRLRLSPLSVAACIRIQDSLQDGTSRFYSEIRRIRRIVELTEGPLPVLFLLDELLQTTNSHDRLIGAEAVARALTRRGAIGLLTTQDLALTEIVDRMAGAVNVHFEDRLENGRLHFDYRLLPGVVTRSNALNLMRSVGLEV